MESLEIRTSSRYCAFTELAPTTRCTRQMSVDGVEGAVASGVWMAWRDNSGVLMVVGYMVQVGVGGGGEGRSRRPGILHVQYMYTTCTLHVHYMHTTRTLHVHKRTLHVHYTYTSRTLHIHYMYTTCILHVHYTYTSRTLHIHYMYTPCILHVGE